MHAVNVWGTEIFLDEASVTGTEQAILAAVLAEGDDHHPQRRLRAARAGPVPYAQYAGRADHGIGSNTLMIEGVSSLHGGEHTIMSDHMEVGSFIGLAAVTGGELRIRNAVPETYADDLPGLQASWACRWTWRGTI